MIDPIEPRRPLAGVKAVTMTIFQAGPICFAWMADFGADVIKIEPPGTGERGRQLFQRPDSPISSFFETHNRGVKGITLNIQTKKGIEILYELVKDADIFAQNFRPGVAERHGFSYEDLIKVNPRIVYLTTSAYGPDGPDASLPGTDGLAQAMGGIVSAYSEAGSRMFPSEVSVGDQTAGLINFGAVMVGLYHARMTGEGQKIETSLLGGQIFLMGHFMTRYLLHGEKPRRERVRILPEPNLTGSFNDSQGKPFLFQGVLVKDWQPVMTALGCWELLGASGLTSLDAIAKSKEKEKLLIEILDKVFATNTRAHWLKLLRDADVVSGPINDFAEAASDPNVIANKNIIDVDHPRAGKIRVNGFPWKFSKTPARAGVAPELGQHTEEIMTQLGYSGTQIRQLRNEKVI